MATVRANFLLLLTAVIWGFAFVAQRVGAAFVEPFTFNGVRFALGAASLLPLVVLFDRQRARSGRPVMGWRHPALLRAGLVAGLLLFGGASFQQIGLVYTTAGKAGFITGLYVVLVPLFGIAVGHATGWNAWLGALLAAAGLYLLSVTAGLTVAYGDGLVMISAVVWTLHVLWLARTSRHVDPVKLSVWQFALCAGLSLLVGGLTETTTADGLRQALVPILYGGLFSVGIGYTLQVVAQRDAHPAHAAIILSLEAAFAALGGWLLLQETLSTRGLVGCGLMLAGMIVSQVRFGRKSTPIPQPTD